MYTYEFKFSVSRNGLNYTYELLLSSDVSGYTLRIYELSAGGIKEQVHIPGFKYKIPPLSFYGARLYYRGYLIGTVLSELRHGVVHRHGSFQPSAMVDESLDSYVRANLDGWPDGFPGACDDELKDVDVSLLSF